jgi:hypothetical protein
MRMIGAAIVAAVALLSSAAGAQPVTPEPLVQRIVVQLHRPLTAEEALRVRELSAGAAEELRPIHARYVREVAALSGEAETDIAALAPQPGQPPPVPTIAPALERRMERPLTLAERRQLIEADQANRRAAIVVRDRLARRLSELLRVEYTRLRAILPEADLTG